MNKIAFTRRGFLQSGAALAAASSAQTQPAKQAAGTTQHRTQFDKQLLAESDDAPVVSNSGRQMLARGSDSVRTAIAWGGSKPRVCIYRDLRMEQEFALDSTPSAPVLLGDDVLFSSGKTVYRGNKTVSGLTGTLADAVEAPSGPIYAAINDGGRLSFVTIGAGIPRVAVIDTGAGRASLDIDPGGAVHLVYEKRQGLEYRVLENGKVRHSERAAEAYGFEPVVMAENGAIIIGYLGESCRLPSYRSGGGEAWERLGRGGYVAVLVRRAGKWQRHRLADSRQLSKALYPIDGAYGGGDGRPLLSRMEEFSAPTITVGPDGVVEVLWANKERRWIYGCRLLGDVFSDSYEVRGPLEQLTGPCLVPRRVPAISAAIPVGMTTRTRVYLDRVTLPLVEVAGGRRIDFVLPDELATARGLDFRLNQMSRVPQNPVIPLDPPGGTYDSAIVPNIIREPNGWRAELMYIVAAKADPNTADRGWRHDGRASSQDGIHWKKLPPVPLEQQFRGAASKYSVRYLEDSSERDPARRFKGLMRSPDHEPWGYLPVISPDGVSWERAPNTKTVVRGDDDMRVWIDPDDVPERRYKANAIGRSFCGRVAVQFTSPDGLNWNDERETLDFNDPFHARADRGTTGRILLDSWSGPDEEDEIHGGYIFRDGGRWLLHYMKWTPDGHIYCGLAASRDGMNFARVQGGRVTLPLGEPGTWDAGRVALREAPFRVGKIWRQYYTGCAWKHGMGGVGAKTSHFGLNAPNQVGVAEIPVGRWAHVELQRDALEGELITVPLRPSSLRSLRIDAEGAGLKVAVLDAVQQTELPGFGLADFDPLGAGGSGTWRGRGLPSGTQSIRLRVRITSPRTKLYGLEFI